MSNKTKAAETKTGKPSLVPKLRFPEFQNTGAWIDIDIGELLDVRQDRQVPTEGIPLYSLTIEDGITAKTERYNRDFLVRTPDVKKYKLVLPKDIVFNPANLRWGAINYSKIGHPVVVSPIYEVLFPRDEHSICLEFIACSVMRDEQIRRFIEKAQGTLVERVAVKINYFMETPLPLPPTVKEQKKIASCLSSVDELIAAESQKVEALKAHKKGLMQLLFPAEGKTLPKLRFPEFRNAPEWKEKTLGQLGDLVAGLTYSPDDVMENGLLVLRSSNIQDGYITLLDNVYVTPDIKGANFSQPNDILICVRNGSKNLIGKNALIPEGLPKCTHGAFMTVFRSKSWKFVFQLFKTALYQKQVNGDLGATINSINGSNFLKYKFFIPLPPEQEKIAGCLSSIDDLITAQAQKVEALKVHKKGLMQQLFPTFQEDAA